MVLLIRRSSSSKITESKETVLKNLKQYDDNKVYASNIGDLFLGSLATVCKATSRVYYITDGTFQNNVFIPLKNESKVAVEVCFVNGHTDLVIQKEVVFEIKVEDSLSVTSPKPTTDKSLCEE